MKKLLFLLPLLLTACGPAADEVEISGTIKNIRQAELFLFAEDTPYTPIDTIFVREGEFLHTLKTTSSRTFTLLFPNFYELPLVVHPGDAITMKADATHLSEAIIKGNPDNEFLTAFRIEMGSKSEREQRLAAQQFIYDHATSPAATALFRRYFSRAQRPEPAEALPLLEALLEAQPSNDELRQLQSHFGTRLLCCEGQPLPNFEEVSLSGDTLSPETFKGKPLVIALWAAWQRDARTFLRNVRRLERLGSNAEVQFLLVSLDPSRHTPKRLIKYDSLQAHVLCDQQSLSSPLVSTFGLQQLPEFILVSSEGIIQKRGLTYQELEHELKSLK